MSRQILPFFLFWAALAASAGAYADEHAALFGRLDGDADGLLEAKEIAPEHARLFERLLRNADEDRDGRLTAAEFTAGLTPSTHPKPIVERRDEARPGSDALRLLLLRIDTDRDAMLTRGEAPPQLRESYDQLAAACDHNKDGQIAFRELVQAAGPATRAAAKISRQAKWDVAEELRLVEAQQGDAAGRFDRQPNPRDLLASPQRIKSLFRELDSNHDGKLVMDEVPEQARQRLGRLLRRADRDRSGDVSLREFTQAAGQANQLMRLAEKPETASTGESAMASDAEIQREPTSRSKLPETASNGNSSEQVASQIVRRMKKRMDKNTDGRISRQEAQGQLSRRFEQADANGDGQIDDGELRRVAEQLQRRLDKADAKAKKSP